MTYRMVVMLVVLTICGCTSVDLRRSALDTSCKFSGSDLPNDPQGCKTAEIEERPNFKIAYVEFSDQGWLYKRKQLDKAIELIKQDDGRDVQVVLFVHGWKHSADFDDRDARNFRRVVMPRFVERHPEKRTVGIYVGWRGASLGVPSVIQNITFYDRKATAEHVARGSVRELLSHVRAIRNRGVAGGTRKVIVTAIGHSFGGLILFNSLAESLIDTLVAANNGNRGGERLAQPILDRVVLLNPAFEASRFEPLFQAAKEQLIPPQAAWRYSTAQLPVFISITSEADLATKVAFRLGRGVNSFFEHEGLTDQDEENTEYANRLEKLANTHTIGHMTRYRTHELALVRVDGATAPASLEAPIRCSTFQNPLIGAEPRFPLWNLFAKKEVIDGHSDIYRENLWHFIAGISDKSSAANAGCN